MSAALEDAELAAVFDRVLAARPEATALACVDGASGLVLASAARDEDALDAVDAGGALATVVGVPPRLDEAEGAAVHGSERALVVSRRWVQVHERVPGHAALFVVGVAAADGNIGLLASCVRDVSVLLAEPG